MRMPHSFRHSPGQGLGSGPRIKTRDRPCSYDYLILYKHYEAIAKFTVSSLPDLIGESSLSVNQSVMDSGFRRNDEWS